MKWKLGVTNTNTTNKKHPSLPNTSSQGVWKPRDVLKEHPSAMEIGFLLNMFGKTPSRSSKESCFGSFGSEDLKKNSQIIQAMTFLSSSWRSPTTI